MYPAPVSSFSAPGKYLYYVSLPIALVMWLLPLFGVVLTSLRTADDLNRGHIWTWPAETSVIANYTAVFAISDMGQFIWNSVIVSVLAVAATLALSSLAGYSLAKYRLPGRGLLLAIFIAGNFVPFQILMIPVRELMVAFNLYDTRLGLIVFHAAFQTGFATLFMRNFMHALPDAVIESARLDGATEFGIFWRVVLPLVKPAIAGLSVLIFTFVWNDYFWSLVLVSSDSVRPVTAGLQSLRSMWITSWHLVSAASILAALPPAVLFFIMQKHFIAGITAGVSEE